MEDKPIARDKLKHLLVCFVAGMVHPMLAAGMAWVRNGRTGRSGTGAGGYTGGCHRNGSRRGGVDVVLENVIIYNG